MFIARTHKLSKSPTRVENVAAQQAPYSQVLILHCAVKVIAVFSVLYRPKGCDHSKHLDRKPRL